MTVRPMSKKRLSVESKVLVFPQPWNQSRLSVAETLELVEATVEQQRPAVLGG